MKAGRLEDMNNRKHVVKGEKASAVVLNSVPSFEVSSFREFVGTPTQNIVFSRMFQCIVFRYTQKPSPSSTKQLSHRL